MTSGRLAKSCLWAMFIDGVMDLPVSQQRPRSLPPSISRYGYLWTGQRHLFLLPRPAATRPAATRHTATRPAAKRSAAIRPAAKRSCLSHSRPTSLILHDTLHWPRTSSSQLPWEGRGVSDVMLNSFGFISLGTSPFASHRSSGLLCASSLHSCSDTPCGDTPCGDTPCGDTPCGDTPCSHKSLSLAFEAVQLAYGRQYSYPTNF